ncbi:MAG: hypothetical protein OS112_01480 [Methanoregula sp.]|nr:MAG: hypothetical protein OS112_01480 [Methanoregula sp.]
MDKLNLDHFKSINTIIERDSKDATYKFALLRGAIEISQEYSHLKHDAGGRVAFPLGLLVEKWLLYYYPLIAGPEFIPQKNGESEHSQYRIAFRKSFRKVTEYYDTRGGFSAFYNDYVNGTVPPDISPAFRDLVADLKTTITNMPMKHLGYSVYKQHYSLFRDEGGVRRIPAGVPINQELLVHNLGYFSFPKDLYAVFQYLGSFITGDDSLLFQWAQFTRSASKGAVSVEFVLEKLRTYPITERDVLAARSFFDVMFRKNNFIDCVWSGKSITKLSSLHIDHMIPFSVWKNNDLWNLLPSSDVVNAKKRDKIPAPEFIEQRKADITRTWDLLRLEYPKRFNREIGLSLVGTTTLPSGWQDVALEHLMEKCDYLINVRGYDAWSL